MINKKAIVSEILFLILVGASSAYYFDMGKWKSYVRLFSIVEILFLFAALALLAVKIIKKRPMRYTPLLFAYGILCSMQLFPMAGALLLGNEYLYNAAIHLVITILGTLTLALLTRAKTFP